MRLILIGFAAVCVLGCGGERARAAGCDTVQSDAKNASYGRIDSEVQKINASIAALQGVNNEVSKQIIVNLQDSLKILQSNREKAAGGAAQVADNACREKLVPLQTAVDVGVTAAMGGLNLLLPPRAWHIDVSDIISHGPLGGDCSFVRNPLGHGC